MLRAAGLYQVNKTKGADVVYLVLVSTYFDLFCCVPL